MENRRPQLNPVELHQVRWALGNLLALLSAWTVWFIEVDAWLLVALATVLVPIALVRPAWVNRVPPIVQTLAFPVIVLVLVVDLVWLRQPLPALVRLSLLLVIFRACTPRRRRDDLQLVVLGLFLVVVAGVLTVSLAFAVQLVAFTACALALLLVVTVAETGPVRSESESWVNVDWRRLVGRLRATADWRVWLFGGALFAGVVAVSAVLFLLIPRFELNSGLFMDRLVQKKSRSGFSENIRFGDVVDIQQDTSVAFTVDVERRDQIIGMPYWRMLVLDDYRDGGFGLSKGLKAEVEGQRPRTTRLAGQLRRPTQGAAWTFYFEAGVSRYLPTLGQFRMIGFAEPQPAVFSPSLRMVGLQSEPPKMFPYRVDGMEVSAAVRDLAFGRRWREHAGASSYEQLPEAMTTAERDQLAAAVAEIGAGAGDGAAEFGRRATDWLESRHAYALQSSLPPGGGDPLCRWLSSRSPGHCELFAGSFVLLARQAGYPARLVTGFKGFTWNAASESMMVRNSMAHAWAEIFDQRTESWLRVDPTPGATAENDAAAALRGDDALLRRQDSGWSARLDGLRVFWYRRIVNFDQADQVELAKVAKQAVEGSTQRLRAAFARAVEQTRAWLARPWVTGRGLVAGLVMVAIIACGWWLRRRGGEWWWRWRGRGRSGLDPVRQEAGRWLRELSQRDAWSSVGAAELKADLERVRYGPRGSWPEPGAVFRRARALKRASSRARVSTG